MAGRTRFRIAVVAMVAAAGLPVGADAAPAGACPTRVTTTRDGWRRIAAPSFAAGGRGLSSYAVVPDDPGTYLATNGLSVSRSADGGCTWRPVYTLPASPEAEHPFTQDNTVIETVVAGTDRVYLLLLPQAGPPRVLVGNATATSWTAATIPGLTNRLLRAPALVVDASGTYAYLLTRSSPSLLDGTPGDLLYATADGGTTWLPRPVDAGSGAVIRDVAVDPLSGSDVWATSGTSLLHSANGGQSWELAEETEQDVLGLLSVTHRPGQPVQVVAASARESLVHVRAAGGGELTAINTPGPVTSMTGGRGVSEVAVTTASGAYELDSGKLTWAPAHTGDPVLDRLSTDYTATPMLHACACSEGTIWSRTPRHFGGRGPEQPRGDSDDYPGFFGCAPSRREADPPAFAPSAVLPSATEVVLQPGQSKTVTYRFRVQPRVLDLYFLLDGGSRAQLFGCAARQGGVWAAHELARTRNVRAGMGEYRDYLRPRASIYEVTPACLMQAENDFVYRRRLRLGPVDATFRESMSRLHVGHCRPGHAALEALRQTVDGLGADAPPRGRSPYDIRAGQDADFTDGAYKVVVHVAGGYFAAPERTPGYPGAGFQEAIDALVDNDVKQVGIYIAPRKKKHHDDEPTTPETGAADLERVARETGTLARKPVDCATSRVRARVKVGEPLTCTFLDDRRKRGSAPPMGEQMVALVSALTDPRPIGFSVLSGADAITRGRTPAAPRTLDHLLPHTLTHTVTYRCGAGDAGLARHVEVGGQVGSSVVAKATTLVRCGAPVPQPRLDDYQPPLSLIVPVAAPAAPNLPPNNLAPNTAPQPNSQPQNIAQHLLAGAGVPQEEAQPRLAYADAAGPPPAYDELAMSALPPRRSPYDVPAWLVVEAALVATCAAGAMAVRRSRTAQARLRRQRF